MGARWEKGKFRNRAQWRQALMAAPWLWGVAAQSGWLPKSPNSAAIHIHSQRHEKRWKTMSKRNRVDTIGRRSFLKGATVAGAALGAPAPAAAQSPPAAA